MRDFRVMMDTRRRGGKPLADQVRDGDRTVCVSLYLDTAEKHWQECTFGEAAALLHRATAPRHHYRLSPWQWTGPDGVEEYDPYGPDVAALKTALRGA